MNLAKLVPGLREEAEFDGQFKELERLLGDLEDRSELIALDKKKEQEARKTDLFDINKSISTQIQDTSQKLGQKLDGNLKHVEDLDVQVSGMETTVSKLMQEYKRAMTELATKKTEDLVDSKMKEQLTNAKNLFFKKVLREIVVGNDKGEDVIRVLENKLSIKEKLLKKALLAAEHYRLSIEKVEAKYQNVRRRQLEFLSTISSSVGFGFVKLSDKLSSIDAQKLMARDFRNDRNLRTNIGMKDRMLFVEGDRLSVYEEIGSSEPTQVISMSDINDIVFLKEDIELSYNMSSSDQVEPWKPGGVFYIKLKLDQGGFMVEPERGNIQKWDYIFFIVKLIIAYSLQNVSNQTTQSSFRSLCLESNFTKIQKQLNLKALDPISTRRNLPFNFDFPVNDQKVLDEVEDVLMDWEILEQCASREMALLSKKASARAKEMFNYDNANNKTTQTDPISLGTTRVVGDDGASFARAGDSMMLPGVNNPMVAAPKTNASPAFNYQIPQVKGGLDIGRFLQGIQADRTIGENKGMGLQEEDAMDLPSPRVELDMSVDSREYQEVAAAIDSPRDNSPRNKGSKRPGSGRRKDSSMSPTAGGADDGVLMSNPMFSKMSDTLFSDKAEQQSVAQEIKYRESVSDVLTKGVAIKGSGLGNNSGKFLLLLNRTLDTISRVAVLQKKDYRYKMLDIKQVVFEFEYRNEKTKNVDGNTFVVIQFTDGTEWEFKTPRNNRNVFFHSLVYLRLNYRQFLPGANI